MDIAEVNALDATIKQAVNEKIAVLEKTFEADILFYYGQIYDSMTPVYRDIVQTLSEGGDSLQKRLVIFLNTPGGSVETVEKYAFINRHFYNEVYFVVPEQAMSAGTVFCLSGDKIYMDFASSLGPIDPQIFNGERYVPALGYLDKIQELVDKSNRGILLNAVDLFFLQRQDTAFLRLCEQQKTLTIDLIEKWLVEYKFKDLSQSEREKAEHAKKIAKQLGDNTKWLSHGRYISIEQLKEIGLEVDDYSNDKKLTDAIRGYNDLLMAYIRRGNVQVFMNSKLYF